MSEVRLQHFRRATADIGANGDNDTLPFDVDVRFINERQEALADLADTYCQELNSLNKKKVKDTINSLEVFSERLFDRRRRLPDHDQDSPVLEHLSEWPWDRHRRGARAFYRDRAHSYRYAQQGDRLFDRASSWRAFREACIADCEAKGDGIVVVQTDISSFYEHVYHHRIENCIDDLFPDGSVATHRNRFLSKLAAGKSFGLPVGGQCSRILAELVLSAVNRRLTDAEIEWRRYVNDFVLVTTSQAGAYRALAILSHALADYGLTLNRTKTTILTGKHFCDYVRTQLGDTGGMAQPSSEKLTSTLIRIPTHVSKTRRTEGNGRKPRGPDAPGPGIEQRPTGHFSCSPDRANAEVPQPGGRASTLRHAAGAHESSRLPSILVNDYARHLGG